MQIEHLYLENFRNYTQADVYWHPQINLLSGLNAQGKSNLLEAIVYLSLTTSFRAVAEQELLAWEAPHFFLTGKIQTAAGKIDISAAYDRSKQKRWRVDEQPCTRRGQIVGLFHTVIFSPEDVDLVKAGPSLRRRFLNRQISQLSPEYFSLLQRYNKVVSQRNGCLRQDNPDADILQAFNQQLIRLGAAILWRRRAILTQLAPLAAELHAELSGGEELKLNYQCFSLALEATTEAELEAAFAQELQRLQQAELARRITMVGPHRDDLDVYIDGTLAKRYASQGQQRTVALALKLAELQLAEQQRGEAPVLLLDDVLSELDEKRRAQLLQQIGQQTQTFITSTERDLPLPTGQVWLIERGTIKAV